MTWSEEDLKQMKVQGVSPEEVDRQLALYKTGNTLIQLQDACTLGNGIQQLSEKDLVELVGRFEQSQNQLDICKFVPASGAASRMFQFLFEGDSSAKARFEQDINLFPFSKKWREKFGAELSLNTQEAIVFLLSEEGLNYADMPKGMISFHNYGHEVRTAFEEHLFEGKAYAQGRHQKINFHFTVAPKYAKEIEAHLERAWNKIAHGGDVQAQFELSVQSPSTDTIAVNEDNTPFRDDTGNLVFRPGGHGALIHNLDQIDADLIFIKNIDNVLPEQHSELSTQYKKALGGLSLMLLDQIHELVEGLNSRAKQDFIVPALNFIDRWFSLEGTAHTPEALLQKLNKPLRVCGMVKNLGEPGGGPFWVKYPSGRVSSQIVEKAQINLASSDQESILASSTHFNPVDLVCAVRNHHKEKFDLTKFVDRSAHFIARKSIKGKAIKALELPGLWNGGMAFWNTVFVEVPLETFSPVKTVNDLLRPEHQV